MDNKDDRWSDFKLAIIEVTTEIGTIEIGMFVQKGLASQF